MPVLPAPQPLAFDNLMRAQAQQLRAQDRPPTDKAVWVQRRTVLREAMMQAMRPLPEKPSELDAKVVGELRRPGYRIEKVIFQSQADVWVTSSLYLPAGSTQKRPAVLVVHGHWAGARRDPTVQARCLGLVHLGFVVLAVDAFGAGERYTQPASGTYHGSLYSASLWPAGQTLLGLQVYDNRRAIDYLLTRPEVDGTRLGITGASGGGNQSMYAGALDDRIQAVVPVCSVGNYQAYLRAACCVCEVLPGALKFTEEGDVLGLVAPRSLLVISATRDAFQFSVDQAKISLGRAQAIYNLHGVGEKLRHATFESPHAYNQPMRELMYGWMTRWLKNEGTGMPIAEPKHEVEKVEDLACFPTGQRPAGFAFPPTFAQRTAQALVARVTAQRPDHVEDWESTVVDRRRQLQRTILGGLPDSPRVEAKLGAPTRLGTTQTTPVILHPEPDLPLPTLLVSRANKDETQPACVLLHFDGKEQALQHPLAGALLDAGFTLAAPDLRATGETRPTNESLRDTPDHHSAEHALWIGRPLLGQWVFDVQVLLDWLALQPGLDRRRLSVVGIGQAGLVAACAGVALDTRVASVGLIDSPSTWIGQPTYPAGTRMGLLAPGLLRLGDLPHLLALLAPRKAVFVGSFDKDAFAFSQAIYRLHKAEPALTIRDRFEAKSVAAGLG